MSIEREQQLYDALKLIASYLDPEKLQHPKHRFGLSPEEAIQYAYENVLDEARSAIKGMRRPTQKAKT